MPRAPEMFVDRPLPSMPPAPALVSSSAVPEPTASAQIEGETPAVVNDDRQDLRAGDRVLLIIEDDPNFAPFLLEMGHAHGFKCLVAARGQDGLALAREFTPTAITLDLSLPDLDGWRVLDRLKEDLATRHVPVLIISVSDEPERGLKLGSLGFVTKPAGREELQDAIAGLRRFVERPVKHLLIVEDDEVQRLAVQELIGDGGVQTTAVADAESALTRLEQQEFDCLVVDLRLPGPMTGAEFVEKLKGQPRYRDLPIVIYTGKELSPEEETRLNQLARSVIFKDVRSPERLFDQTALWLHRNAAGLPEPKRRLLETLHHPDAVLAGKKVLLVDDDIRNIFAMTSLLERYRMEVLPAESGPEALETLRTTPDVDVVLMDIMLPEMDGYEATRQIRRVPAFASLPVIALTAKAMRGDREKCLEAGCSDYIAKPVDTEGLLSLLRLWLHR